MTTAELPTLQPEHLVPGDVMLFRGSDATSIGIQFVDGSPYDHSAIIAPSPDGDPRLHMFDVGFIGANTRPVAEYPRVDAPDLPSVILVRRHRVPNGNDVVVRRAREIVADTVGYDFERLLVMVLTGLTRFSPGLWGFGDPTKAEEDRAAVFIFNLHQLFRRKARDLNGALRVCSDLVKESFDVFAADAGSNDPYYGLVFPHEPLDGLLNWAASFDTLRDWTNLAATQRPSLNPDPSVEPARLMYDLYTQFGLAMSDMRSADQGVSTDELRASVRTAADLVLSFLGVRSDKLSIGDAPPEASRAAALYLFDQFLRRGASISPRNIYSCPSLFDLGYVDMDTLRKQLRP